LPPFTGRLRRLGRIGRSRCEGSDRHRRGVASFRGITCLLGKLRRAVGVRMRHGAIVTQIGHALPATRGCAALPKVLPAPWRHFLSNIIINRLLRVTSISFAITASVLQSKKSFEVKLGARNSPPQPRLRARLFFTFRKFRTPCVITICWSIRLRPSFGCDRVGSSVGMVVDAGFCAVGRLD
jgi:hypothetical protein